MINRCTSLKKAVSWCLITAMMVSAVLTVRPYQASAASDSLTSTRGVYWFDPHITGIDLTDTYIYDDALLKGDSKELNWKLAAMTYELAVSSISSEREPRTDEGYKNKSRNLRAYLEDNGFVDFDTNEDYTKKMTTRTMGVACAHKKITDGGKEYTLLAIVPRSAGYESEWGGNFIMGESGDHEGFGIGKDKVLDFAKDYISRYGIGGDIKVWTAGYSRGAGVTNQVGAALIRDPNGALGDEVTLTPENLYCYTYGTPNSASTDSDYQDSKFDYIHNLFQPYDITTVVPFEIMGFTRYGKNFTYAEAANKDRMLSFLKDLNKDVYDAYTTSGDPVVFFKPKKIDVNALANRELKFVDDDKSYLPADQEQFAKLLANTAGAAFKTRKNYVDTTQEGIESLAGYYFSHLDKSDALVEGAMESKYAIPAIISLYFAYMADRYREHEITEAEREELLEAIEEFEKYINKAIEEGVTIPDEIIEKMNALKARISTMVRLDVIADISSELNALMVQKTLQAALTNAGLLEEDEPLYNTITSLKSCQGLAHTAAYFLLYDELQEKEKPEKLITFDYLNKQFKHLATLIGNAGSYQRPHNNEVILSWLRTKDPSYDDFAKETAAQISGYRRLYIDRPSGVTVTGTVKDANGKTVAKFKNDKITSRSDKWIGITTCDTGSWLRLPAEKKYTVELRVNKDTKLNLTAAEYDVYDAKIVRKVTEDKKYNWKKLSVKATDKITWHISKVTESGYKMPSSAYYYIEKTTAANKALVAKGTAKGSSKIKISWNKVSGAGRYVIYMSMCNYNGVERTAKKVKTVKAGTRTWTTKTLKKGVSYKFYVTAEKKTGGKYKAFLKSLESHVVTANQSKTLTNPKSMKLNKTKVTLKTGKTFKIKGKVTKIKSGKKLLTTHVSSLLRYVSDNKTIAKVSSTGKVTAVATGKCKIYVQAPSGMWKTLTVTVK